jgi:hypothetical protein
MLSGPKAVGANSGARILESVMKNRYLIAAAIALSLLAGAAQAYTCNTSCYWVGKQQYCNTTCY